MVIKVNTSELQGKSSYGKSIASRLGEEASQINSLYYKLDAKVRDRQGIGSSMKSLQQRLERAQRKMYNISGFLAAAAAEYSDAESTIIARLDGLNAIRATSGDFTSRASGGKKWYNSNIFKIAVGAVVIGVAVAAVVMTGGAVIAVGAAVGAGIGALGGGVVGGVVSEVHGGNFMDGFADGFMAGAIGGAVSGAVGATSVGFWGAAAIDGGTDSLIYAVQTLQNDGQVTIGGLVTSFAVGMGISAISSGISSRIRNKGGSNPGKSYSGDLMSSEEAARYSEYWRKLGMGSDKTWMAFSESNPGKTIDDYFELVNDMSPWPIGQSGIQKTLKAGDRFYMAVENNAPENIIGGFGVKEKIPSTKFIRENLAVKSDWKKTCNVIREFEVNDGVRLNVLEGPVGPQIDLAIDAYLPGDMTIIQYDLFSQLGSGISRGDYVHIVDEFWVD